MSLHIFNSAKQFNAKQSFIDSSDVCLLKEDAVYLARQATGSNIKVFALKEDLDARGIKEPRLPSVDFDGFVELTEQHARIISW